MRLVKSLNLRSGLSVRSNSAKTYDQNDKIINQWVNYGLTSNVVFI